MRPFVIVEYPDQGNDIETTIVGVPDMEEFKIDWDEMESDPHAADDMVGQIMAKYADGEPIEAYVESVLDRLREIANEINEEEDEEPEEDDWDEDDDDVILDPEAELEAEDEERS